MFKKIDGRLAIIDGRYNEFRNADLLFTVRGPSFLNWLYVPNDPTSPTTGSRPNGLLFFKSTKPNSVFINYGDGSIINYPFIYNGAGTWGFNMRSQITSPSSSGEFAPAYDNHIFTSGSITEDRIVSVSFENPEYITNILSTVVLFRAMYPSDIDKLPALNNLTINYASYLTSYPASISNIQSLIILSLVSPSQTRALTYPDSFLGLTNLQSLSIASVFDFSDPIASGLFKLGLYGNKLTALTIDACRIGIVQNNLPVELLNLTNLTTLSIGANNFTRTPDRVGQMISLQVLALGGFTTESIFNDWGDFSGLINLNNLRALAMTNLPTTIPTWFSSLVKLKSFITALSYQTLTRQNAFVDNVYAFIIVNASMTGAGTLPFRGMNIVIYAAATPSLTPRPSGTFQAPIGYVTGSSNGTPASQMEKIWVMTNQYNHTWSVNPT